jgi:DNA-binding Xre family transcriptional regulator
MKVKDSWNRLKEEFMADEGYNRLREWLFGDPNGETEVSRMGLLASKGLSVETLSRKMGVTRAAVYLYLSDQRRPTPDKLYRLCQALDVPLEVGASYCTPRNAGRPAKA